MILRIDKNSFYNMSSGMKYYIARIEDDYQFVMQDINKRLWIIYRGSIGSCEKLLELTFNELGGYDFRSKINS